MNLVDKSFNVRRGFADVNTKHHDELLYTLAEKRKVATDKITARAGLISECASPAMKHELESQQANAKLKLQLLDKNIKRRTGFDELLINRCRSALTDEAWHTVIALAKQDQARIESQMHIEAD